jgi:hypothetical protein
MQKVRSFDHAASDAHAEAMPGLHALISCRQCRGSRQYTGSSTEAAGSTEAAIEQQQQQHGGSSSSKSSLVQVMELAFVVLHKPDSNSRSKMQPCQQAQL